MNSREKRTGVENEPASLIQGSRGHNDVQTRFLTSCRDRHAAILIFLQMLSWGVGGRKEKKLRSSLSELEHKVDFLLLKSVQ